MSKPPISAERLAANRANATQSTGPRTSEGKARSSQNARKHSFNPANFTVLRLEDLAEVANRRADLIECYQPVNSQELWAIDRLALAQQALDRCSRAEAGMYTACLNESLDPDGRPLRLMYLEMVEDIDVLREQNRNFILWEGFTRLMRQSQDVLVFLRIQAQTERLYRRAAEDFERIRKLRKELPNQPNFQTEPQETKPVEPPKTNPPDEPAAGPPSAPEPAPVAPSRKPPPSPAATLPRHPASTPNPARTKCRIAQPAMPASGGSRSLDPAGRSAGKSTRAHVGRPATGAHRTRLDPWPPTPSTSRQILQFHRSARQCSRTPVMASAVIATITGRRPGSCRRSAQKTIVDLSAGGMARLFGISTPFPSAASLRKPNACSRR